LIKNEINDPLIFSYKNVPREDDVQPVN